LRGEVPVQHLFWHLWVIGGIREHNASKPFPNIILHEFWQEAISVWIPGVLVPTYDVCDLVLWKWLLALNSEATRDIGL
jgi:hypothetical protein